MKCPHCNYLHGWDSEKMAQVNGEHGDFYELSNNIRAEKHTKNPWDRESRNVQFCPKCGISFIEP